MDDAAATSDTADVASKHRMLIFAQQKRSLDIVESILLKRAFPTVAHLRLDGDVAPLDRQAMVHRFNRDPSIPIMLLTTKVGGLGLNLTGADTVVFLEHDWNPMADLQAMDRAHRLGQKRVVSVYRLITKDTIEERIMGLQRWKLKVANAVVNQQNASMDSMQTDSLLDLLSKQ
jgi:TATA-binding protein-associated factor